jgi:hypothetical protein
MSARLLYHTADSASGGVSPFDEALGRIAEGADVRLACPYISLNYLCDLLARTANWRLLTDAEAWLSSVAHTARPDVLAWVRANEGRVRHCERLHAKALIAQSRAVVGSANFTRSGLTRNHELAVELSGEAEVRELSAWFDALWAEAAPPRADELERFRDALPVDRPRATERLTSTVPEVNASLRVEASEPGTATEQQIAARFALAPSREWVDSFLDLANEMIAFTGLGADDARLAVTLPQGPFLPITINRRYVLCAMRLERGSHNKRYDAPDFKIPSDQASVELILPAATPEGVQQHEGRFRTSRFDPWAKGETETNVPLFLSFVRPAPIRFERAIRDVWREAVLAECDHGRTSPFRRFHQPALYRAITDAKYRRQLLDLAFADAK